MSPYLSYLLYLLILVVGFGLGLAAYRQFSPKIMAKDADKKRRKESIAYIKGVNYILSDAHDLAIEEFIKAVQINSDTVETYLALGNLFRSKGEVSRAIRIH
jgi:lipopolysaccharide biosynthesis regulator YciM